MVHRGKGEVRQSRQEETPVTSGTIPKDEDSNSLPECQPTVVQAEQNDIRNVVREEQYQVSTPEIRHGEIKIVSGSYWYNVKGQSVRQYVEEDGVWYWYGNVLDSKYKERKKWIRHFSPISPEFTSIFKAIERKDLIPITEEEATLILLTDTYNGVNKEKEELCN